MMEIVKPPAEYADRFEMGALAGATVAAAGITGSASVLHAVQGCAIEANHLRSGGPVAAGYSMPVMPIPIGPTEVIQGGNVNLVLQATLLAHGKGKRKGLETKLVFIFTSDATSMIEDDIGRAAAMAEEQTGVPVIALDTASFLGSYAYGAEQVYAAVLERFCSEAPKQSHALNLVGPQLTGSNNWPNDIVEIRRLLEAADVEINHILAQELSVNQLPELTKAKTNLILCGEDMPFLREKMEDVGMESWGQDLVLPVGMHNTEEWYLAVARKFGDEQKAQAQIDADFAELKRSARLNYNASWQLTGMYGKRASLIGGAAFTAALARAMFYDFNIQPVVIGLLAETPLALERAEQILAPMSEFIDIQVMENPTFYSYGKAAKEAGVNFAIGMDVEQHLMEGLGIPHNTLTGPYFLNHWDLIPWPYVGVRGTAYLVSELWRVVRAASKQPVLWQMQSFQPRREAGAVS